jgi:hypothetical protein
MGQGDRECHGCRDQQQEPERREQISLPDPRDECSGHFVELAWFERREITSVCDDGIRYRTARY